MPRRSLRRSALLLSIGIAALPHRVDAQRLVSGREAAAGAAVLAGALLLDRAVDRALPDGGGTALEPLSDALNHGGRPLYPAALLAGTWAGAELAGRGEVAEAAVHVAAALAAGGVLNGALKYTIGRERPSETADPYHFVPLADENRWQSFPSGHTVVAFSVASALAEEARRPWVTALAYGGAAAVGWSRVYENKHWTSDVAAGALIGILAGRSTVRLLHRPRGTAGPTVAIAPGLVAVRIPLR
jgi:membrane-associated phospholipid phosphatase